MIVLDERHVPRGIKGSEPTGRIPNGPRRLRGLPFRRPRPPHLGVDGMSKRSVGSSALSRIPLSKAGIAAIIWLTLFAAFAIDYGTRSADAEMVVPSSIAKDCSVDVTGKLLSWIASVPDGSTLSFPSDGCYRIDGQLRIEGRANLRFEGNGATFRAVTLGGLTRHHWWFVGGRNIVLRDMVIRGANPKAGTGDGCFDATREFQHGVALWGVQGALLENLQIYDVYGDSVYVGNPQPSRDITIRGGRFEGTGRQGFGIVHAEGVVIDRNYVSRVCKSVFDLEPLSGQHLRDITITNNTVGEHRHLFLPNSGAAVETSNVLVAHNRVLGQVGQRFPNGPGSSYPTVNVSTAGSTGWVVRNNDFARFEGSALKFNGATGITVACNRIRWIYGTGTGVHLSSSRTATVTNNRFVGATAAVSMTQTGGLEMSGNELVDSAFPSSCGTIGPVAGVVPPAPAPTLSPAPSPSPTVTNTPAPTPTSSPSPIAGPDWAVICTTSHGPFETEEDAQTNAATNVDRGNPHCQAQELGG